LGGTGKSTTGTAVDLIDLVKIFLFGAAFGADPVIGQVFEWGSRLNAAFIIALFRVVDVAAGTFVFVHDKTPCCNDELNSERLPFSLKKTLSFPGDTVKGAIFYGLVNRDLGIFMHVHHFDVITVDIASEYLRAGGNAHLTIPART
jgi:hypothetical protein